MSVDKSVIQKIKWVDKGRYIKALMDSGERKQANYIQ